MLRLRYTLYTLYTLSHFSTKIQNICSGPKVVNLINIKVGTLRNRLNGCNFLATISFTRPRVSPFFLTRLHETTRPGYSFSILFIYIFSSPSLYLSYLQIYGACFWYPNQTYVVNCIKKYEWQAISTH